MEPIPGKQGWGKPSTDYGKLRDLFTELQGFFHLSTGHKHTGVADDAPKMSGDTSLVAASLGAALLTNPQAYDPGRAAIGVLRVAANVADTETVTIGADVYEFDRAADGVVAGRIAVTGHADDTPANATDALIAAINASGTENVKAVDISANEVLIHTAVAPGGAEAASGAATALAETLGGANNAWDTANLRGGRVAGVRKIVVTSREALQAEVDLGNMHFVFDFAPTLLKVEVFTDTYENAGGAVAVAWDGAATITGNRIVLNNGGTTDWAAGSLVVLTVTD